MKRIAIAIIATLANFAASATPITITGHGASREEARQDAFTSAIQTYCGVAVLSEKHFHNGNTVRNDVANYSSCRVKSYKILDQGVSNDLHYIKFSITLEPISQSQRLFNSSNEYNIFDQGQTLSQLETYQKEKTDGDTLLRTMFADYPYNAFNIKNNHSYIVDDPYRNFYLVVPYQLSWNYNYVQAMHDTFSTMSNNRSGAGVISISAKNPKSLVLGKRNFYYMNDLHRIDQIKDYMTGPNELRLKIEAKDNRGNSVLNVCYNPDYQAGGIFYSVGINKEVSIFGNDIKRGEVKIKLTMPADVIYDVYVQVAADRDCKL